MGFLFPISEAPSLLQSGVRGVTPETISEFYIAEVSFNATGVFSGQGFRREKLLKTFFVRRSVGCNTVDKVKLKVKLS